MVEWKWNAWIMQNGFISEIEQIDASKFPEGVYRKEAEEKLAEKDKEIAVLKEKLIEERAKYIVATAGHGERVVVTHSNAYATALVLAREQIEKWLKDTLGGK